MLPSGTALLASLVFKAFPGRFLAKQKKKKNVSKIGPPSKELNALKTFKVKLRAGLPIFVNTKGSNS